MLGDLLSPAFTKEEYADRLAKVRRGMAAKGIDVLMVRDPSNILYLTGYNTIGLSNYAILFIPLEGELSFLLRFLETHLAFATSIVKDVAAWDDHENPFIQTRKVLMGKGWLNKKIAFEKGSRYFSTLEYQQLEDAVAIEFLDGSGIVDGAKIVKSPAEIERLRRAATYTTAGMEAGMKALRPNVTENDVAAAVYAATIAAGSEEPSGGPIITGGKKSGIPHTNFWRQPLQEGDVVLFEHGGVHNRYVAAQMRTGVVGPKYDPQVKEWYDLCVEALENAIACIKPGVTSGEVDEACRGVFERAGLYENFRKRTGYSIGATFAPSWMEAHIIDLKKGDPRPLQAGMVFHIPPALRKYGEFAVGVSETVLVTESGCEPLTKFSRELYVSGR